LGRALAAAVLLLAAAPALPAEPWTSTDLALEAAFGAALLADWLQTRQIPRTPDAPGGLEETNPILGRRPSAGRVNGYFAAAGAAHLAIAALLPRPWRSVWQTTTLGLECLTVRSNLALGLRLTF
jgi:hypothetical protein